MYLPKIVNNWRCVVGKEDTELLSTCYSIFKSLDFYYTLSCRRLHVRYLKTCFATDPKTIHLHYVHYVNKSALHWPRADNNQSRRSGRSESIIRVATNELSVELDWFLARPHSIVLVAAKRTSCPTKQSIPICVVKMFLIIFP